MKNKEIIKNMLTYLAIELDSETCYNSENGKMYIVDDRSGDKVHLSPIDNDLNKNITVNNSNRLIFVKVPSKELQNGFKSVSNRFQLPFNTVSSGLQTSFKYTAYNRDETLFITECGEFIHFNSRRIEPIISMQETHPKIKNKLVELENLILKKLDEGVSEPTLRKAHKSYVFISNIAGNEHKTTEKKLQALLKEEIQLKESLNAVKQNQIDKVRTQERGQIMQTFKTWAVASVVAVSVLGSIYFYFDSDIEAVYSEVLEVKTKEITSKKNAPTLLKKVYSKTEINNLINRYEIKNGVKFWGYRRGLILSKTENKKLTDSEIKTIIHKNKPE
jgi:hypothetical protein